MSEGTPEASATDAATENNQSSSTQSATDSPAPDASATDTSQESASLAADLAKWKELARKNEQRAKENASAAKRLAEIEEQSKTETERLLDGARKETAQQVRAEIVGTFGQRLARQSFRAAAAQRNPEFDAVAVLDDINLARYVGDDGEPDEDAIRAAVERLVPQGGRVRGDVGQGVRNTAPVAEVRPGMDRLRHAFGEIERSRK